MSLGGTEGREGELDGLPTYERERNWVVLGLLLIVLVVGAGAVGLAASGYAWI